MDTPLRRTNRPMARAHVKSPKPRNIIQRRRSNHPTATLERQRYNPFCYSHTGNHHRPRAKTPRPKSKILPENGLERPRARSSAATSRLHRRRRKGHPKRNRRRTLRIRKDPQRIKTTTHCIHLPTKTRTIVQTLIRRRSRYGKMGHAKVQAFSDRPRIYLDHGLQRTHQILRYRLRSHSHHPALEA
jgi:hypothetical protein